MQPSVSLFLLSILVSFHLFSVYSPFLSLSLLVEQQRSKVLLPCEAMKVAAPHPTDLGTNSYVVLIFILFFLLFLFHFSEALSQPLSLALCLSLPQPAARASSAGGSVATHSSLFFIAGLCSRGLPVSVIRIWGLSWLTCILSLLAQNCFHC